jgi:hypothetical protein
LRCNRPERHQAIAPKIVPPILLRFCLHKRFRNSRPPKNWNQFKLMLDVAPAQPDAPGKVSVSGISMFQPRVKLEFVRRYCLPQDGWRVCVNIDPSEEGRTGNKRETTVSLELQEAMVADAPRVREAFQAMNVNVAPAAIGADYTSFHTWKATLILSPIKRKRGVASSPKSKAHPPASRSRSFTKPSVRWCAPQATCRPAGVAAS